MSAPRILLVHPGHPFSTADVFDNLSLALTANGAHVIEYRLDRSLTIAEGLTGAAAKYGVPDELIPDVFKLAGNEIPGFALLNDVQYAIVITGCYVRYGIPLALRKAGIITALVCTESPYETTDKEQHIAAPYDLVFTNERTALPLFARNKPGTVHYLPHAYTPSVHHPGVADADKVCDACFIGTGFPERQALFNGVDWSDIDLILRGTLWEGTESADALTRTLTDNRDAAAYYRSARININTHRTTRDYGGTAHIGAHEAESVGPRLYEIAACGGFQLVDNSRQEAKDLFGDALATYRHGDSADLERQLRYWLTHPEARAQYAAAQHAAIQGQTWDSRAATILDILTERRAPRAPASLTAFSSFTQELAPHGNHC